ncbi:site-2 protease family protein [Virgibacillus xinjiangensis]|uniref:Site-2 protease family protein n=1 Tax=Virgibacillus xinjiangensis TaxID=393090 RepID=A0ABV7CSK4_9BACI
MTTLHSLLPRIHVHPILMVFIVISFLTGTFVELAAILSIVFFHELGHYTVAKLFKWRVESIILWVFGGIMETDEHGNRPVREEALVTLAGPMQHVFIYIFIYIVSTFHLFPESIVELLMYYNTVILLFNLVPIWPLDGGKLLFLFLTSFLPFKRAYYSVLVFSMASSFALLLAVLLFYPFTLSIFLIWLFLLMENRTEWKQRHFVFLRFLLKRYEGNNPVKAVQPIHVTSDSTFMDVFSEFMRDRKHSIYISYPDARRSLMDENDCLKSYFHDRLYDKRIGEAMDYVF